MVVNVELFLGRHATIVDAPLTDYRINFVHFVESLLRRHRYVSRAFCRQNRSAVETYLQIKQFVNRIERRQCSPRLLGTGARRGLRIFDSLVIVGIIKCHGEGGMNLIRWFGVRAIWITVRGNCFPVRIITVDVGRVDSIFVAIILVECFQKVHRQMAFVRLVILGGGFGFRRRSYFGYIYIDTVLGIVLIERLEVAVNRLIGQAPRQCSRYSRQNVKSIVRYCDHRIVHWKPKKRRPSNNTELVYGHTLPNCSELSFGNIKYRLFRLRTFSLRISFTEYQNKHIVITNLEKYIMKGATWAR